MSPPQTCHIGSRPLNGTFTETSSHARLAPHNATISKPEMRTAFLLPPDRRMERSCAIVMVRNTPAGAFVGEKIHMQNRTATAGADHCCLLLETVLFDNVEGPALQLLGKSVFDQQRRIRRDEPVVNSPVCAPQKPIYASVCTQQNATKPVHGFRLLANSINPRSGVVSPKPTLLPRMSQMPSSGS